MKENDVNPLNLFTYLDREGSYFFRDNNEGRKVIEKTLNFYGLRCKSEDLDTFIKNKNYNFNGAFLHYQHLLKTIIPIPEIWQHMLKNILTFNKFNAGFFFRIAQTDDNPSKDWQADIRNSYWYKKELLKINSVMKLRYTQQVKKKKKDIYKPN
jgi:hypothetical protein